jgi:ribosome-binding protein aMBF1 (putative translation factor)
MGECYKCGISGERVALIDAISDEGLVKFCRRCLEEERLPFVKKVANLDETLNKKQTVYERLSRTSGLDLEEHKERISSFGKNDSHDSHLRNLVEVNYNNRVQNVEKSDRADLIHNFHWVVMRARRSMKITQEQLARKLAEPVNAIRLAERGILPNNDYELAKKLERFLRINILTQTIQEDVRETIRREGLRVDSEVAKTLTLSDLQDLRRKKEPEMNEAIFEDDEIESGIENEMRRKSGFKWFEFLKKRKARREEEDFGDIDLMGEEFGDEETIEMQFNEPKKEVVEESAESRREVLKKKKPEDLSESEIKDLIWKR